jgi:hypothetical protein
MCRTSFAAVNGDANADKRRAAACRNAAAPG